MIIDYLKLVLTWPVLGAILIFWFVFYYRKEIRDILHKSRHFKFRDLEISQTEASESAPETLKSITSASKPNWELMYYGKMVVVATMYSLLWLYKIGSATKTNFFYNMVIAKDVLDVNREKEAQFSTMLNFQLIELDGEVYRVTQKGKDFLRYYGLIGSVLEVGQ